jgi:TolB protein
VVKGDGEGLRRLTADPARDSLPAWSPDSRKIVFRSERTGNSDLYVMNADGSRVRQLTDDPSFEAHAEYSPDGERIVFDRRPPTALFTMRSDGTKITQITPDSLYALDAAWSPNGNRLVFINGFCGPCPYNEVVTMKANGRKIVQITNDNGVEGYNMSPSWSPDGKKIVFSHEPPEGPPSDIHVINADGTGRTNITDTPDIDEFTPDWWGPVEDDESNDD